MRTFTVRVEAMGRLRALVATAATADPACEGIDVVEEPFTFWWQLMPPWADGEYRDACPEGYKARRAVAEAACADYRRVTVAYRQPDDAPMVLGIWKEGTVMSFTAACAWTAETAEHVDPRRCDRCGVKHARKVVYLVRLPAGEVQQVGGQCADAMNCETRVAAMFRVLDRLMDRLGSEMEDDCFAEGRPPFGHREFAETLNIARAVVRTSGYVSQKKAEQQGLTATSGVVTEMCLPYRGTNRETLAYRAKVHALAASMADSMEAAVALVAAKRAEGWSEFVQNLVVCVSMHKRQPGIIAYLGFLLEEQAGLVAAAAVRVAERPLDLPVGPTRDLPGTFSVKHLRGIASDWGDSTLVHAVDDDGNVVSWFDRHHELGFEVGDKVRLRAGVKGRSPRGDALQLQRVKVTKV